MAETRFCPACGTPREPDGKFCGSCGRPFEDEEKRRGGAGLARGALDKAQQAAELGGTALDAASLADAATSDEPAAQAGTEAPSPPRPPATAARAGRFGWVKGAWGVMSAIVAVTATTVSLIVFLSGDEASAEVFLEPASSAGNDPFTPSVAEGDADVGLAATPSPPGEATGISTIPGDRPGLYGGTRDQASCDVPQLERYLLRKPVKSRAWVEVLNGDPGLRWSGGSRLEVEQIGAYLAELTPVILRADTRVTNHGFANGRAFPVQSVLQAGTAVLVDGYGVPRVRCASGSPLLPPVSVSGPAYTGPQWPGFGPGVIVVVVPASAVVDTFVLVDPLTGDPFGRPPGTMGTDDVEPPSEPPSPEPSSTATVSPEPSPSPTLTVPPEVDLGRGDVQVTLLWSGGSDLDLHVIDPDGSEIYYQAPASSSGGQLDHDDQAGCQTEATHVENVFWPSGRAPAGEYLAFVVNFNPCADEPFELRITVDGEVVHSSSGRVAGESGAQSPPVTFAR